MIYVTDTEKPGGKFGKTTDYKKMSDVSDGYHTFGELYQYRMLLQALLFNQWAQQDKWQRDDPTPDPLQMFNVHKSYRHSDGELCFGKENYFIVMATIPGIGQISNHYKGEHWDLFNVPEQEFADEYDGHTPADAMQRMEDYIKKSIDKL
jgi:hypothetical protein